MIAQENGGVSAARNRGAAEAATNWVAFLDADDEWYPTFLERTITFAEQHPEVGAVLTNFRYETTGKTQVPPKAAKEGVLPGFFATILVKGASPAYGSSILVRRKTLLDIGGFPVGMKYGEDADTWNRLARESAVRFIADPLVLFHPGTERNKARFQNEPFFLPCTSQTLRGDWASRIPGNLKRSAREYINLAILNHVSRYFSVGKMRDGLWLLLTQCRLICRMWLRYVRTWNRGLELCLPQWLRPFCGRLALRGVFKHQ